MRDEAQREHTNTKTKKHVNRDDDELFNVDHRITNAKLCHIGALCYISEDIETLIKMMIKGRSPTMRHVTRTNRFSLILVI